MRTARLDLEKLAPDLISARRGVFIGMIVLAVVLAVPMLRNSAVALPLSWLSWVQVPLFVLLFSQIAMGFVLAALGFLQVARGGDPIEIMRTLPADPDERARVALAPTAIVMPVFNEDVDRVRLGVERMWESLGRTGKAASFDFFILSDSNQIDNWMREECAWLELCRKFEAFGRIFYRRRRTRPNGKSGNIADFCRRWGKRYRYLIVLDADSIMSGETLVRLVQAMEVNPRVGLIQTMPKMVLGDSLLRRMLQFTVRLCGELFTAGSNYWQGPDGGYWGHNAILRLAVFMEHCDLPDLPEKEHSQRHILSHDTVEAALMIRAGYEVWLAYREEGSYEEGPPTLTDLLKRDRRWCQGNLQHFWFLFARDVNFTSRIHIFFGLMAYLSSPLWLLFLVLSGIHAYGEARYRTLAALPPDPLFDSTLSPLLALLVLTLALLFVPKIMGLLLALPRASGYGGWAALTLSVAAEITLSILLAPILMIFHAQFVIMTLLGLKVRWATQNRREEGLSWMDCVRTYGWVSLLGVAAGGVIAVYLPSYLPWFAPVFGSWILAVPFARAISSSRLGRWSRRAGLFLIPEETHPPPELRGLADPPKSDGLLAGSAAHPAFVHAVVNPFVNAVHVSLLRERTVSHGSRSAHLEEIAEKAISLGDTGLPLRDKLKLLGDADAMLSLHRKVWARPLAELHPEWAVAVQAAPEKRS